MAANVRMHKDFKSSESEYCFLDADTICKLVGRALDHQRVIFKRMLNYERRFLPSWWSYEDFKNFLIDVEKIDRLYYIYEDVVNKYFLLICRVEHYNINNNNDDFSSLYPIYVKLFVQFDDTVDGEILLSMNACIFIKNIFSIEESMGKRKFILDRIRRSLIEDKILLVDDELSSDCNIIHFLRSSSPFCKTHKDFKSLVWRVCNDAETICSLVGQALNHQFMFDKALMPERMKSDAVISQSVLWSKEELQKLKIDVEKIDRLYGIYFNPLGGHKYFGLVCRMEYENSISSHVYIILFAHCDRVKGFLDYGEQNSSQGSGSMTISKDANHFFDYMTSMFNNKKFLKFIHQSLIQDGIYINNISSF